MDEARIERDWRDLVENGVVVGAFPDAEGAEWWLAALERRARILGRRIRTGEGDTPFVRWAALTDWQDVVPRAVQLAKLRQGFAWLAVRSARPEGAGFQAGD